MPKKKLVTYLSYTLSIITLMLIISFSERKLDEQMIDEINIDIRQSDNGTYITKVDVVDMLNAYYPPTLEGNTLKQVEIEKLDSLVESSPFIKSSKTYSNNRRTVY